MKNQTQKLDDMTIIKLIEQFNKSTANPRQYLLNLLAAQCFLGSADGGAILRINPENNIDVLVLYPQIKKNASAPIWLSKSYGFAHEALSSDTVILKPLDEAEQLYGHPARRYVVLVPMKMLNIGKSVAAFVIVIDDKITAESISQKLQLLVGMLSYVQTRPTQHNLQESCKRQQRAMETLSAANRQEKFTSAAMALCNE
ncbi:hypothetical protein ACFL5F_05900, partial [Planctomycetota bacterium]